MPPVLPWPEYGVALLAEGVDRNGMNFENWMATAGVALLAEGVDRNLLPLTVPS